MLRIRVVQINGAPTPTTLAQEFDERGGSIGRSAPRDDEIGIADYTLCVELIRKALLFANGMPTSQPRGRDPLGLLEDRPPPSPPAAFAPPASSAIKRCSNDDSFAD